MLNINLHEVQDIHMQNNSASYLILNVLNDNSAFCLFGMYHLTYKESKLNR